MQTQIVVTANGVGPGAPLSPVLGRCPALVFADPETMQFESVENPAFDSLRGTGIEAAQFIVERGAQAVVTGNVGPNAFDVFQASGVPVYLCQGGTVRQAVEAYKAGRLQPVQGATVPIRGGKNTGRHQRDVAALASDDTSTGAPLGSSFASRTEEVVSLRVTADKLRTQLTQVLERLEQLRDED